MGGGSESGDAGGGVSDGNDRRADGIDDRYRQQAEGAAGAADASLADVDGLRSFESATVVEGTGEDRVVTDLDAVEEVAAADTAALEDWFAGRTEFDSVEAFVERDTADALDRLEDPKAGIVAGVLAQREDSPVEIDDVVAVEDRVGTEIEKHGLDRSPEQLREALPVYEVEDLEERLAANVEALDDAVGALTLQHLEEARVSLEPFLAGMDTEGEGYVKGNYHPGERRVSLSLSDREFDNASHEIGHAVAGALGIADSEATPGDATLPEDPGQASAAIEAGPDADPRVAALAERVEASFERSRDRATGEGFLRDYQAVDGDEFLAVGYRAYVADRERLRETQPELELALAERVGAGSVRREQVAAGDLERGDRVALSTAAGESLPNARVDRVDTEFGTIDVTAGPDRDYFSLDAVDDLERLRFERA